jgi:hypothetical protein
MTIPSWKCSQAGHRLEHGYRVSGSKARRGDEVFRQFVLARIIEPVSLRC